MHYWLRLIVDKVYEFMGPIYGSVMQLFLASGQSTCKPQYTREPSKRDCGGGRVLPVAALETTE